MPSWKQQFYIIEDLVVDQLQPRDSAPRLPWTPWCSRCCRRAATCPPPAQRHTRFRDYCGSIAIGELMLPDVCVRVNLDPVDHGLLHSVPSLTVSSNCAGSLWHLQSPRQEEEPVDNLMIFSHWCDVCKMFWILDVIRCTPLFKVELGPLKPHLPGNYQ